MDVREQYKIGDVISVKGSGVPRELEGKYFRVESFEPSGAVKLSLPYEDPGCVVRYYSQWRPIHGGR